MVWASYGVEERHVAPLEAVLGPQIGRLDGMNCDDLLQVAAPLLGFLNQLSRSRAFLSAGEFSLFSASAEALRFSDCAFPALQSQLLCAYRITAE
jgi:hypothetical protein